VSPDLPNQTSAELIQIREQARLAPPRRQGAEGGPVAARRLDRRTAVPPQMIFTERETASRGDAMWGETGR